MGCVDRGELQQPHELTMRLLHLCVFMKLGYGVSVVVDQLCEGLKARNISNIVGCLDSDQSYDRHETFILAPDADSILALARREQIDAVIAYTTPYFECVPRLANHVATFLCECGDPTPELFDHDSAARRAIVENKRQNVYPFVRGVMSISDFLRFDIGWAEAEVVRLGWEHAWSGAEPLTAPIQRGSNQPLCLGALARLGAGEARYKGFDHFVDLAKRLRAQDLPIRIALAGRGDPAGAKVFDHLGIDVNLNISDRERTLFYRDIDVFFSPSLWEGCNLPLMEAQANGALGLALDTGAHPEYTPFVMRSVADVERLILNCSSDPVLLQRLRGISFDYITQGFGWDRSVESVLRFLYSKGVT
jgi:glycosyltransferase involved in cell wall biosynthesis